MNYTTVNELERFIAASVLTEMLDDDGDGQRDEGLLDGIIESSSQAVDAYLCSLFDVPFTNPVPALVSQAGLIFTCYALFARRLTPEEKNPWTSQVNMIRDRLQKVGEGKLPLDAQQTKSHSPGVVITTPVDVDANLR